MIEERGRRGSGGRPRSEEARTAVLHAVDDLLLEIGYAAMTMKNIAERAGVSRQTLYRWWSTKAEILLEATAADAADELAVPRRADATDDVAGYLEALAEFLTTSGTGAGYRALVGEAQHDAAVAQLLSAHDILGESARVVLERSLGDALDAADLGEATARLVGPTFYRVLSGRTASPWTARSARSEAEAFVHEVRAQSARRH